jgi:hypothetical protein
MADSIILTKLDADADRILDAFEQRTGLEGEDDGDRRIYDLEGREHEVEVVQTLTGVDEDWTEHVGFQDPV